MSALPAAPPAALSDPDRRLEGLADCVRRLDPGTRALLDLSVRRRLRDDAMAPLLRTDPFHLAWRRARALERVAGELGGDQPVPLATVRAALESLPREAWDPLSVPQLEPPRPLRAEPGAAANTALVPAPPGELAEPRERLRDRLDSFASSAPTVREALAGLGRAFARKAVRTFVWGRTPA